MQTFQTPIYRTHARGLPFRSSLSFWGFKTASETGLTRVATSRLECPNPKADKAQLSHQGGVQQLWIAGFCFSSHPVPKELLPHPSLVSAEEGRESSRINVSEQNSQPEPQTKTKTEPSIPY